MEGLPTELSYHVFSFLQPEALALTSLVSKDWLALCQDEVLWKQKCREELRKQNKTLLSRDLSWREFFYYARRVEENWKAGKPRSVLVDHHACRANYFRFDEQRLVSGYDDGVVKVFQREDTQFGFSFSLQAHLRPITCLQYDAGGILRTSSIDQTIKTFHYAHDDPAQRQYCLQTLKGHTDQVNCLQYDADHSRMVSGGRDKLLKLWDPSAGKELRTFSGHTGSVLWHQHHGDLLLSASGDHTVRQWDLRSSSRGGSVASHEAHSNWVYCLQFLAETGLVATASADSTVKLFDIRDMSKCLTTFEGHSSAVIYIQMDGESHRLVSAATDRTARVWDIQQGKAVSVIEQPNETVITIQFEDELLVACSEGDLYAYDFAPLKKDKNPLSFPAAAAVDCARSPSPMEASATGAAVPVEELLRPRSLLGTVPPTTTTAIPPMTTPLPPPVVGTRQAPFVRLPAAAAAAAGGHGASSSSSSSSSPSPSRPSGCSLS